VRFEDEILIRLLVEKKGTRSLAYQFRFFRANGEAQEEIALGRLVVVSTEGTKDGSMKAVSLPKALADKIEEAPVHLLAKNSTKSSRSDQESTSRAFSDAPGKVQSLRTGSWSKKLKI